MDANDRAAVEEFITRIQARYPTRVVSMGLFGSKARGDADSESDIDLLVIVTDDDGVLRSELWRMASDVSLEFDVVLSAHVFSRQRWQQARRVHVPLYRAVVADLRPVATMMTAPSSADPAT
jgi:predicted nucleotidyltransferase